MPPLRLHILLTDANVVKRLKDEAEAAKKEAAESKRKYRRLSEQLADVQLVNIELIDFIKAQGYQPRPGVDIRDWEKK